MASRFGLVGAWCCLILHLGLMGAVLLWRWAGRAWERQPEREDEPPSPDPREPELLQDAA
jgi:Na+-driven multidrug efflux pump